MRPGPSAASHGGLTQSLRPTARGGKDCCQALAQASSTSGANSTTPGAVGKPKARSPPAYSRTEATRSVEGALSGKKARSRAGERGPSSSTTPKAPCSQRKFVKPSEVSGELGTVSCQKAINYRRASSSARGRRRAAGPRMSSTPRGAPRGAPVPAAKASSAPRRSPRTRRGRARAP